MKKKLLFIAMFCFALQISKLNAQVVSTFAGTAGVYGSTNGMGTSASFYNPYGVAVDASGNVYVADGWSHLIRKITSSGVVSTFAGSGIAGSQNGIGTAASFNVPYGIAVDVAGNVYVCEGGGTCLIRKITPAGVVTTLAGGGTGTATNGVGTVASFSAPTGIAVDGSGNVYVADQQNNMIRKITPSAVVSTFAGSGIVGHTDGQGIYASFFWPSGVAVDGSGNVYVGDEGNNMIRKITSTGIVSTIAGSGMLGSLNGTGIGATFKYPYGVVLDALGNLYVVDSGNNMIRKITPEGVVSTLAGSGGAGSINGLDTLASFSTPAGIAIDASGNLYVADTDDYLIRKITMPTTGVEESTAISELKLYPIPVTQTLTLALTLESESDLKLELISMSGIKVASTEASYGAGFHELSLSVTTLSAGIYVANVYSNGQVKSQRVVVER